MAADDWYRGTDWSDEAQSRFFEKLGRARSQRVQYLRIKGCELTDAPDAEVREAGRGLLRRVLEEDPPDEFWAPQAHHDLGSSLVSEGWIEDALPHFEAAMGASAMDNQSDLAWVEGILALDREDRYAEAVDLLTRNGERASDPLPATRFRWNAAAARLAHRQRAHGDAAELAAIALRCLDAGEPFPRHPGMGLAHADRETIAELQAMCVPTPGRGAR